MSEEQVLVERILKGDSKAFAVLVKQYEKLVFHVVQRLVVEPHDVEDISQEVFIKVYRGLSSFSFSAKLSTWIARIAYLTAINYLRKYRKLKDDECYPVQETTLSEAATPEQAMIQQDRSAYIQALILQLPLAYRTVLTLYHLEEFSLQEIEAITGMPEGTVKNYLYRARKQLKEKLTTYLKDECRWRNQTTS